MLSFQFLSFNYQVVLKEKDQKNQVPSLKKTIQIPNDFIVQLPNQYLTSKVECKENEIIKKDWQQGKCFIMTKISYTTGEHFSFSVLSKFLTHKDLLVRRG